MLQQYGYTFIPLRVFSPIRPLYSLLIMCRTSIALHKLVPVSWGTHVGLADGERLLLQASGRRTLQAAASVIPGCKHRKIRPRLPDHRHEPSCYLSLVFNIRYVSSGPAGLPGALGPGAKQRHGPAEWTVAVGHSWHRCWQTVRAHPVAAAPSTSKSSSLVLPCSSPSAQYQPHDTCRDMHELWQQCSCILSNPACMLALHILSCHRRICRSCNFHMHVRWNQHACRPLC